MTLLTSSLLNRIPSSLREQLISEFDKLVRNYRERRWEPAELDGGRFCEVTYTVIKGFVDGKYPSTAVKPRNMLDACRRLEQANRHLAPHSIRILIPRLIVGHVGGDVDSNHMDATLVVQISQWILAELIRVYHSVTTDEAQQVVEGLVGRIVPTVWELPDGRLRVLKPSLSMRERMLWYCTTVIRTRSLNATSYAL